MIRKFIEPRELYFTALLILFIVNSSALNSLCGQLNPSKLDLCISMHKDYNPDTLAAPAISIVYVLTFVSAPVMLLVPIVGFRISPFFQWMILFVTNLLISYLVAKLIYFIKERKGKKRKLSKKSRK
jgi:hypothetical protein